MLDQFAVVVLALLVVIVCAALAEGADGENDES